LSVVRATAIRIAVVKNLTDVSRRSGTIIATSSLGSALVGRIVDSATSTVVVRGDGLALTFATHFEISTLATTLATIALIISKIFALPHVGGKRSSRRKDGTASRPRRSIELLSTIEGTIATVGERIDVGASVQTVAREIVVAAAKLVRSARETTTTISFCVDDFVTTNGSSWLVATEIGTKGRHERGTIVAIDGTIKEVGAGVDTEIILSRSTGDEWATIFVSKTGIAGGTVVDGTDLYAVAVAT